MSHAQPTRTVRAGERPTFLGLGEVWRYRDLLYFLVRRDLLGRYRQTVLGIAWALLHPLITMVVFSLVLGRMAQVPSEGVPYPIFAFLGILAWQFFASCVGRATGSLAGSAHLIGHVYFPRMILPLGSTAVALADYLLATLVLAGLMIGYGVAPAPTVWLVLPTLLAAGLIGTGIGMGLGALNLIRRDFGHALPFALQIGMFAAPVVYPLRAVPEAWRPLYALNPATGLVHMHRAAALGLPIDGAVVTTSLGSGLVLAWVGYAVFRRLERGFADHV